MENLILTPYERRLILTDRERRAAGIGDDIFMPGIVKPEGDYIELQRLGKKLGIPVPAMHVSLESIDAQGNLVDRYEDRSRTFNRNMYNYLFALLTQQAAGTATFGAGFLAMKDTGGTVRTFSFNGNGTGQQFSWVGNATIGVDTKGIVVGTGTTAESFEHNTLVTKTAHGNGSGQISYTAQNNSTQSYNSGTKTWTATAVRIFNNNSGGTIVIAETGFYADAMSNPYTFMLCRDLLGATVSVLSGGQLTVTYTFTLVFPA